MEEKTAREKFIESEARRFEPGKLGRIAVSSGPAPGYYAYGSGPIERREYADYTVSYAVSPEEIRKALGEAWDLAEKWNAEFQYSADED